MTYLDISWTTEHAKFVTYADDATLYHAASSFNGLNEILNKELKVVHDWIISNKLVLNVA